MARELVWLDIDITALGKVHFGEQGSLREDGADYALFWSGKNKDECRLSGVGFMIKTSTARKLQSLPVGPIMSLRLPIKDKKFATVISVYAPTLQAEIGVKEAFYRNLITSCSKLTQKTISLSLETSMQEWDETSNCGKES